jgi:hypothetical protein
MIDVGEISVVCFSVSTRRLLTVLVVFYRKYMITLGALEKQQSLSGKLRLALSELPYDFEGSA